jgi:hypothetical protein
MSFFIFFNEKILFDKINNRSNPVQYEVLFVFDSDTQNQYLLYKQKFDEILEAIDFELDASYKLYNTKLENQFYIKKNFSAALKGRIIFKNSENIFELNSNVSNSKISSKFLKKNNKCRMLVFLLVCASSYEKVLSQTKFSATELIILRLADCGDDGKMKNLSPNYFNYVNENQLFKKKIKDFKFKKCTI